LLIVPLSRTLHKPMVVGLCGNPASKEHQMTDRQFTVTCTILLVLTWTMLILENVYA
jgi:hypothetical protein